MIANTEIVVVTGRADLPCRRSIRLRGYDYSRAGAYFVTICTQNRQRLFGEIVDGKMRLNDAGEMVRVVWNEIPNHYPGIDADEFAIMPNHIHGIVVIAPATTTGQPRGVAPTGLTLPDVVHRLKTMTTKCYTDGVKQHDWPAFPGKLWQRNYWEHIVRDEPELHRICEYIQNNPAQWELDKLFVDGQKIGQARGPAPTVIREPSPAYTTEAWMV